MKSWSKRKLLLRIRRQRASLLVAFATILAAGCDPVYHIKSDIIYDEKMNDFNCVAQAIERVPQVKMLSQKTLSSSTTCSKVGCIKGEYVTTYEILGTKRFRTGEVKVTNYFGKEGQILNQTLMNFEELPPGDNERILSAVKFVGEKVSATCVHMKELK